MQPYAIHNNAYCRSTNNADVHEFSEGQSATGQGSRVFNIAQKESTRSLSHFVVGSGRNGFATAADPKVCCAWSMADVQL